MKYQDNVKYQGNFGGVAVTFTLHNFSENVKDEFNRRLAYEAKNLSIEAKRSIANQG